MDKTHISELPIGIFDSGFGGLTAARQISELLPHENIIYLADNARLPYGNKTPEMIQKYTRECCSFLSYKKVKAIIIACHTASSYASIELQAAFDEPVIGIVKPCLADLGALAGPSNILILATEATIQSEVYQTHIKYLLPDSQFMTISCPLFAPMVEHGITDGAIAKKIIQHTLMPVQKQKFSSVILACTHYPLLQGRIMEYIDQPCEVIDPAISCAKYIRSFLASNDLLATRDNKGSFSFYTTGDPKKFKALGQKFLGQKIKKINKVYLKL